MARAIAAHALAGTPHAGRVSLDSCGTGPWHAGQGADPRAVAACARRGVRLDHVARQIDPARDFARFDLLLVMDWSNHARLVKLGAPSERLFMLRAFDPALAGLPPTPGDDRWVVPDPYEHDDAAFDRVLGIIEPAWRGLLASLANGRAGGRGAGS
jgi:protein-tyrosine phosphatase